MYKITNKIRHSPQVYEYEIYAPLIPKNARAGQFVIIRVNNEGERIPLTICGKNVEQGTVRLLVQTVGLTTALLAKKQVGECISDIVGPLGKPCDFAPYNKVCLVGGGIGGAVILPQAQELKAQGKSCDIIFGARTAELLLFEQEMRALCDSFYAATNDGSKGHKGFVTDVLAELLKTQSYDMVMAVGPLPMMQAVANLTRPFGIKTIASMNSLMVDGTGMCGCCRLLLGDKTVYACTQGPEFDAHLIDFDNTILRNKAYKQIEEQHYCRLKEYEKN